MIARALRLHRLPAAVAFALPLALALAYDLWYLRHRSLVLDLAICVRTFTTLVTGSGAR